MSQLDLLKYDDNKLPYIDLGTTIIRFEREQPPQWMLEIAQRELRELPEIVEPAIAELRRLIQTDTALNLPLDDECMLMFLRPCKFYPESAFKRLKNFFLMKPKYGDFCENVLPAKLEKTFASEVLTFLPDRDKSGRRLLLVRAGKQWKPQETPVIDLFRAVQLFLLGSMSEPATQITGAVIIFDMDGLPMSHLMHFTPAIAAMLIHYVQDCVCLRLKAIHVVNNSYIFHLLFAIFKPFMREKLRKRIFLHGKNFKPSLEKHIDENVLPAQYGGTSTWELPSGQLQCELFKAYTPLWEQFQTYGYRRDYVIPKS